MFNSSAVDGWHNLERIRKEDFRSLHIASAVLARMSSGAAEEPSPKGHARVVTLQRALELSCAIVSVCKVKLDYLEAKFFHEFFGSDDSPVAPSGHVPAFGPSPLPCAAVRGTPLRGPLESYQHYAIRASDLWAQSKSRFRWEMRKKGYGFLSYRCRIPVRHCLTHVCSGLRELAMPAQNTRSHGAIS